jgi:hypothetical protein
MTGYFPYFGKYWIRQVADADTIHPSSMNFQFPMAAIHRTLVWTLLQRVGNYLRLEDPLGYHELFRVQR